MPYFERDGVRLHYVQRGSGGRPLVFVHGWCCDHTFFEPQFERFARDHPVAALDLRGCGASDRPSGGYDMATFADDVAALCAHLRFDAPVLVGHSMGGGVAVEVAARHPELPAAIVTLDPGPLDATPRARAVFAGFAERMEGPDGEAVRRAWVDPGPVEASLRTKILDTMCSVPLPIAIASLRGTTSEWNGTAALAMGRAPLLAIVAAVGGSNHPDRIRALRPSAFVGVTVGAGHFHQLEVPDQVDAMIARFLEVGVT